MTAMVDIYKTEAGDTWDLIAYKVYGSEQYMRDLLEANPAQASTAVFGPGVELVVPDVTPPVAATLPAWMQG